jgi:hypothetical protein
MIVPWLTFIAVGLMTYAAFLKIAARLLRYSVSWRSGFHFAGIMLIIVIFGHVLTFSEPLALRIGHNVVLLLGLVVLGGWFFNQRGTNHRGAILGWGGGMRLVALAFAIAVVVAFAIVVPVQGFLNQRLSTSP